MLAIAGGKGGVGKTTTAVGLGVALARRGRAPILVDGDRAMPDLHQMTNVPVGPGVHALATGEPLETACHETTIPGLAVVPAGNRTDGGAGRPSDGPLTTALERLATCTRPVIVDCPGGAGPDAAEPLRAADQTVLVSRATSASVRDAIKAAAMARALGTPPAVTAITGETRPELDNIFDTPVVELETEPECTHVDDIVGSGYHRLAKIPAGRNI